MRIRDSERRCLRVHGLFAERGQLLLPQCVRISSNVCERIVNAAGNPTAPNQLKVRSRFRLAGLDVPQSLSCSFQLVEIRLADQHGVVLASTAGDDDLTPAVARNCLEQGKKFLASGGNSKYGGRHGIFTTCTTNLYMIVDFNSRSKLPASGRIPATVRRHPARRAGCRCGPADAWLRHDDRAEASRGG